MRRRDSRSSVSDLQDVESEHPAHGEKWNDIKQSQDAMFMHILSLSNGSLEHC